MSSAHDPALWAAEFEKWLTRGDWNCVLFEQRLAAMNALLSAEPDAPDLESRIMDLLEPPQNENNARLDAPAGVQDQDSHAVQPSSMSTPVQQSTSTPPPHIASPQASSNSDASNLLSRPTPGSTAMTTPAPTATTGVDDPKPHGTPIRAQSANATIAESSTQHNISPTSSARPSLKRRASGDAESLSPPATRVETAAQVVPHASEGQRLDFLPHLASRVQNEHRSAPTVVAKAIGAGAMVSPPAPAPEAPQRNAPQANSSIARQSLKRSAPGDAESLPPAKRVAISAQVASTSTGAGPSSQAMKASHWHQLAQRTATGAGTVANGASMFAAPTPVPIASQRVAPTSQHHVQPPTHTRSVGPRAPQTVVAPPPAQQQPWRPPPDKGPLSARKHSGGKSFCTTGPAPLDKELYCEPCHQANHTGARWFNATGLREHQRKNCRHIDRGTTGA